MYMCMSLYMSNNALVKHDLTSKGHMTNCCQLLITT